MLLDCGVSRGACRGEDAKNGCPMEKAAPAGVVLSHFFSFIYKFIFLWFGFLFWGGFRGPRTGLPGALEEGPPPATSGCCCEAAIASRAFSISGSSARTLEIGTSGHCNLREVQNGHAWTRLDKLPKDR